MDSVYLGKIIDVEISALGSLRQSHEGISQLYSDRWGLWLAQGRCARGYGRHGPTPAPVPAASCLLFWRILGEGWR